MCIRDRAWNVWPQPKPARWWEQAAVAFLLGGERAECRDDVQSAGCLSEGVKGRWANGTALLEALPSWRPSIRAIGAAIKPTVDKINDPNGPYKGCMTAHGQGAMWGGMFTHSVPKARAKANLDFKKRCLAKGLLPYFVPVGGFMLTPRYDDDAAELGAAVAEMAGCALETIQAMGWQPSELLPQPAKAAKPSPGQRVFAAAPLEAAAAAQRSKATGAGTISAREAKVACLATAYAAKAPAESLLGGRELPPGAAAGARRVPSAAAAYIGAPSPLACAVAHRSAPLAPASASSAGLVRSTPSASADEPTPS